MGVVCKRGIMLNVRLRFPLIDHKIDFEIDFIVNDTQYTDITDDYNDMKSIIRYCVNEELERRFDALKKDMSKHCESVIMFDTSKYIYLSDSHVIIDVLKLIYSRLTKFTVSYITAKFYMATSGSEEGQKYAPVSVAYFVEDEPPFVIPAGTTVISKKNG